MIMNLQSLNTLLSGLADIWTRLAAQHIKNANMIYLLPSVTSAFYFKDILFDKFISDSQLFPTETSKSG